MTDSYAAIDERANDTFRTIILRPSRALWSPEVSAHHWQVVGNPYHC